MNIWHITIGVQARHPSFAEPAVLLSAVRALVRAAGAWLLMFCIVDEHIHILVVCDRARAGRVAQAAALALRPFVGNDGLEPARFRQVNGNRHLDNLVTYVVRQPAKHGVSGHPALWGGSCFPDLVGARVIDGFDPKRIAAAYPRYRVGRLCDAVGLAGASMAPVSLDIVHRLGPVRLIEATTAAHAVPELTSRAKEVTAARAAAARLGLEAGFRATDVAVALGVHRAQISRLERRAREDIPRAARVRLALEEAVSAADTRRRIPG